MKYILAISRLKRPVKYIKNKSFVKSLHIYDNCIDSYVDLLNTVCNHQK
jgi:hypothetical protein